MKLMQSKGVEMDPLPIIHESVVVSAFLLFHTSEFYGMFLQASLRGTPLIVKGGDLVLFSGAHLHATTTNYSDR